MSQVNELTKELRKTESLDTHGRVKDSAFLYLKYFADEISKQAAPVLLKPNIIVLVINNV